MLDGHRYFASFPDETQPLRAANGSPRALTPALRAALADLERALRCFLDEASAPADHTTGDGRQP